MQNWKCFIAVGTNRSGLTVAGKITLARGPTFETNRPPDILAFDNFGILEGLATPHGQIQGIASDSEINAALEKVGVSLPALQRPSSKTTTEPVERRVRGSLTALEERGWEYLIRTSPNYQAARALAAQPPGCVADSDPSGVADGDPRGRSAGSKCLSREQSFTQRLRGF